MFVAEIDQPFQPCVAHTAWGSKVDIVVVFSSIGQRIRKYLHSLTFQDTR